MVLNPSCNTFREQHTSTFESELLIQNLWNEANSNFQEVSNLAKKDSEGNVVGIWCTISDFSHSFLPWEEGFTKGLYLAGVECELNSESPEGWIKWTIPSYEYIFVENNSKNAFMKVISYLEEKKMKLVGAIDDFNYPQTGKCYIFFPIRKN